MKIITTVGVYANWKSLGGDGYVVNGVAEQELSGHVEYNKTFRPGRALFVDGQCLNQGYLPETDVQEWTNKLKDPKFTLTKDTRPYR